MIYLPDEPRALKRLGECKSCHGTGYDLSWPHPPCGCGLLRERAKLRAELRERQQAERIRTWESIP